MGTKKQQTEQKTQKGRNNNPTKGQHLTINSKRYDPVVSNSQVSLHRFIGERTHLALDSRNDIFEDQRKGKSC